MLFTNLKGFNWVQDDGTMLIFMVEMSTKKKEKKQATKKKKTQSRCTDNNSLLLQLVVSRAKLSAPLPFAHKCASRTD